MHTESVDPPGLKIVPKPLRCQTGAGSFSLDASCRIAADAGSRAGAETVAAAIRRATGLELRRSGEGDDRSGLVRLALVPAEEPLGSEGYRLKISPEEVLIEAAEPAGQFYAIQTLVQLLTGETGGAPRSFPAVAIEDRPRFGWRGLMVDVARHFFSVADLQRFIDAMALLKLNTLHLHLVDDQGWRIEIKRYPELTRIGSARAESPVKGDRESGDGVPYRGFYTQEEMREIVDYAALRFITVVPEIEMPGHASAALASYPHLGNSDIPGYAPKVQTRWGIIPYTFAPREEVFEFLENVLLEVMDLFPSRYIHVGGDEAPKKQWMESAAARSAIEAHDLKDGEGLQGWFIRRIEKFLASRGRKLVGWDEIQEGGLPPRATMMVWRDWKWANAALELGNDVVMSPNTHCYFDHAQGPAETEPEAIGGNLPVEKVYEFDPAAARSGSAKGRILGGQGNLWTEYIHDAAHLEYMAFPRACALAEAVWSESGVGREFREFKPRLEAALERLKAMGVNFRPLSP